MKVDDLEDGQIESDPEDLQNENPPTSSKKSDIKNSNLINFKSLSENTVNTQLHYSDNADYSFETKMFFTKNFNCTNKENYSDNETDDDDETTLFVRGASPTNKQHKLKSRHNSVTKDYVMNYYYYDSDNDNHYKNSKKRGKNSRRKKDTKRKLYKDSDKKEKSFSQVIQKENNLKLSTPSLSSSITSDNRRFEICKFYLLDCCIKPLNCNYMHAEFPCKFYYLGMKCKNQQPCKFMHGNTLTNDMKNILIRHIITAPRNILGSFKRFSKEEAETLIEIRNKELLKIENQNDHNDNNDANDDDDDVIVILDDSSNKEKNQLEEDNNNKKNKKNDNEKNNTIDNNCGDGLINYLKILDNYAKECPPAWDLESPLILEDLRTSNCDVKKIKNKFSDDSLQLTNLDFISSEMTERLKDYNITNLYQFNQLSLSFLDNVMSDNDIENQIKFQDNPKSIKNLEISLNEKFEKIDLQRYVEDAERSAKACDDNFDLKTEVDYMVCEDTDKRNDNLTKHSNNCSDDNSDIQKTAENSNKSNEESPRSDDDERLILDELKFLEDVISTDKEINDNSIKTDCSNNEKKIENKTIGSPIKGCKKDSEILEEEYELDDIIPFSFKNASDFDLRIPHFNVLSLSPAREILASIESHPPIMYKLIEIDIPKIDNKKIKIPLHTSFEEIVDPRIRKMICKQNKQYELDPRKKKEYQQQQQPHQQQQQQNNLNKNNSIQNILNNYLCKSKWYQQLKTSLKILCHQNLAILVNEIIRYHRRNEKNQNNIENFSIKNIPNNEKIQYILNELGIYIDSFGKVKENIQLPPSSSSSILNENENNRLIINDNIPSLLSLEFNEPIQNSYANQLMQQQQQQQLLQNNSMYYHQQQQYHQQLSIKPGLLGIAPGIEQLPLFSSSSLQLHNEFPSTIPFHQKRHINYNNLNVNCNAKRKRF